VGQFYAIHGLKSGFDWAGQFAGCLRSFGGESAVIVVRLAFNIRLLAAHLHTRFLTFMRVSADFVEAQRPVHAEALTRSVRIYTG